MGLVLFLVLMASERKKIATQPFELKHQKTLDCMGMFSRPYCCFTSLVGSFLVSVIVPFFHLVHIVIKTGSKITGMSWAQDSRRLLVSTTNGRLILWNAYTATKEIFVTMKGWPMCCALSPNGTHATPCVCFSKL